MTVAEKEKLKISAARARAACPPELCRWPDTDSVPPLEGLIGQQRAVRALDFGLGINRAGYNLFVTGAPGTGRTTSVLKAVGKLAAAQAAPDDWCYVYNFSLPDQPRTLRFPAGTGRRFQSDVADLLEELKVEIPRAFESKEYDEHRAAINKRVQEEKQKLFHQLEEQAARAGFQVKQGSTGLALLPLQDGRPLTEAEFEKLGRHEKEFYQSRQQALHKEINVILRQVRRLDREARQHVQQLDRETGHFTIRHLIEELVSRYESFPAAVAYLQQVEKEVVAHVHDFLEKEEPELMPGLKMPAREPSFLNYRVNLLVDNGDCRGAPVISEHNPTFFNLVGRQEYRAQFGSFVTDYTMIRAGALHRANGGYLVIHANELFSKYFAWQGLKRCLKSGHIAIEDLSEEFRLVSTSGNRPEAIPLTAKVIIIGDSRVYHLLHALDEDFSKLFKVKVAFDTRFARDGEGVGQYAAFISRHCREKKLLPFDRGGITRIVEHGSRLVEDQARLSSRFFDIVGLLEEADYWARQAGREKVGAAEVRKAIEEKIYRGNLLETRLRELIESGQVFIDDRGAVVGQVNGLSVLLLGDYSFGRPSRITVRTFVGREGIVDIERETRMGGPIHTKGVLILSGFLGERYAGRAALTLSATICFEQSYDGIDGDSASGAELCALLSSLADLPLDQSIAMTGSVNQRGQVQPIGGVNEKIEGFYEVCRLRGFTGSQGVIIPRANLKNLMLREAVAASIGRGEFHVWAVENIDEAISILTGVPAGAQKADGRWPADSVNGRVARRLERFNAYFLAREKGGRRDAAVRRRRPSGEKGAGKSRRRAS